MVDFAVPEEYIGNNVEIAFAIPVPGPNGKGLTFPTVTAVLKEDLVGAFRVLIDGTKDTCIPKERIQHMALASNLHAPSVADVAKLRLS